MGESAKADEVAACHYVSDFETFVTKMGCDPRQAFNVDENGFHCKKRPKNTFTA